jgi:hypothetical protein
MTVRVRYNIHSAISSTMAEERDLGNLALGIVSDLLTKGGTWKTVLSAGASNVELYFDNISTINLLIMRTTTVNPNDTPANVVITINGPSTEALTIQPIPSTKEGHFLMSTTGVTSVYASNPGSVDMQLTIVAAGV